MFASQSPSLELRFQALPESASVFRQRLSVWLEDVGATARDVPDVVLACSEAFANAVEHPLASISGMVEIHGEVSGSVVSVAVRDNGLWRNDSHCGDRGLGFAMMRSLMDAVEVSPSLDGTIVTLRRRLGQQPG